VTPLILRRANVSLISGNWQDEDYDVFDGDREVGRIYLVDAYGGRPFPAARRQPLGYGRFHQ
jgi:hypothetical protein